MATLRLRRGHVQPVWTGHPWVYAQAVERLEGEATAGDLVQVVDPTGNFLGAGFYSPASAIVVRILTRSPNVEMDRAWFQSRFERALAHRQAFGLPNEATNGYRLVHAEGDGLPGLIIDRLGDALSVQFLTLGMKLRSELIVNTLVELLGPRVVVDRTPAQVGALEGFSATRAVLFGNDEQPFRFSERALHYEVPFDIGQKTGFYFDQRALRERVEQLAKGKRVLDVCSFIGPVAMAAARGGATEVVAVDESPKALEVGAACAALNGLGDKIEFVRRDARKMLDEVSAREGSGGGYDLVVLDPPRLSPTRAARDKALTMYQSYAAAGCQATRDGGLLVFCSCSAAVDLQLLTRVLAQGAARVGKDAVVLERVLQGADHPVPAAFPEGLYLKALIVRVSKR